MKRFDLSYSHPRAVCRERHFFQCKTPVAAEMFDDAWTIVVKRKNQHEISMHRTQSFVCFSSETRRKSDIGRFLGTREFDTWGAGLGG